MTPARHLRSVDSPPSFGVVVRVSQVMGRSGERFHSPATQEAAARAAVERAGGVVDETVGERGVFFDLDVSGKTAPSDRPGMGAALELVRQGRLTGVAVYDLSRFSRDTVSGLRELQEIAAIGGQVLSAAETIDIGTPTGTFSTTVQLAAQQLRRDEASKAWRATHQSRHDRGLPHGKVPLGYVARGGEVTVDPVLGPAIAEAFRDYAAGSRSQRQIADDLTAVRGVLTRQGVVSRFLRNPFVTGLLIYNGDTKVGRHDPLVDMDTFQRVQARLSDDRFAAPRHRDPTSWLSGLVFCDACGSVLYRRGRGALRKSGVRIPMLRCPGMADGCVGVGAPQEEAIGAAVLAEVLRQAQAIKDQTVEASERLARAAKAGADVAALRAQEQALLDSLGNLTGLLAQGVIDAVAYDAGTRDLRAQLRSAQSKIKAADREAQASVSIEQMASAAERLESAWPDLTEVERRTFVGLFLRAVRLRPAAYRGEPVTARLSYQEV